MNELWRHDTAWALRTAKGASLSAEQVTARIQTGLGHRYDARTVQAALEDLAKKGPVQKNPDGWYCWLGATAGR